VEDIAATLGVRRSDLNVVAASKGLFAGGIQIVNKDGSILEGIGSQVGSDFCIPLGQDITKLDICD
jgi:meiotic recombination protein SPO11